MNIFHPIKALKNAILKDLVKDALEKLPELKKQGLNYLESHKDEFLDAIKKAILAAVKKFIESKLTKTKEKIVSITGNFN